MFYVLSKFLPPLIYPLGLACILLCLSLVMYRRSRWGAGLVIMTLVLLWLSSNRFVTMALVRSLEWQHLPVSASQSSVPQADVIIVLGGGTRAQAFPRQTNELNEAGDRLFYAAWLYQQGSAPYILLSGGRPAYVASSTVSEAECMADILSTIGVPRAALWLEADSRNTHENAIETQAILERKGVESAILVTSALHMPRAYRVFAQSDLAMIPAPTDYLVTQEDWAYYTRPDVAIQLFNLLPSAENLVLTQRALKEYVGMIIYRLRGWL